MVWRTTEHLLYHAGILDFTSDQGKHFKEEKVKFQQWALAHDIHCLTMVSSRKRWPKKKGNLQYSITTS